MALFAQTGTLAGTPITVVPFSGTGSPATYIEVHNLNPANSYSVQLTGAMFVLPPGRKLVIDQPISSLTLDGLGDYEVLAANGGSVMPRIEASANYSAVASPGNPPDNITLEDTGVVWQIKNLGVGTNQLANLSVSTGKLANGAVDNNKLGTGAVSFGKVLSGALTSVGKAAVVTADLTGAIVGDTVTLTYNGSSVIYEFTNGGAPAPGHIGVDLPTVNIDFPAKINANQPDLGVYCVLQNLQVCVNKLASIQAGIGLLISKVGAGITVENTISGQAESSWGIEHYRFEVTATNTSGIILPLDGKNLRGVWISEITAGGLVLRQPTGPSTINASGGALSFLPGGAIGNFMDVFLYVEYL